MPIFRSILCSHVVEPRSYLRYIYVRGSIEHARKLPVPMEDDSQVSEIHKHFPSERASCPGRLQGKAPERGGSEILLKELKSSLLSWGIMAMMRHEFGEEVHPGQHTEPVSQGRESARLFSLCRAYFPMLISFL